MDILPSNIIS